MEIVLLQRLSVYIVDWVQMIDVITFINCFLLSSLSLFLSVVLSKSPEWHRCCIILLQCSKYHLLAPQRNEMDKRDFIPSDFHLYTLPSS